MGALATTNLLTGIETGGPPSSVLRSLAIVGSHPATRELAPYEDPNFEIWLFNESPQKPEVYRRWDASFQMHLPEVYASEFNWVNQDHWHWLQQDHGPDKTIWMQDADPRVPNSRRYPIEGVLSLVPYKYLRSTPAQALALAILLGYQHIQLYGSELTSNTEYTYQATNLAFWIGFAHGRGVDLELHCWHNEFHNQPLYGYEGELQLSKEYFKDRIAALEPEYRLKKAGYERMQDRLSEAMMENKFDKVGELITNIQTMAFMAGELEGALDEARNYLARENPISRQEFERRSAAAQKDGKIKENEMHHMGGVVEYVWNTWRQTGNHIALEQLRTFLKVGLKHGEDAGKLSGQFIENLEYMGAYDSRLTAAGGQRALYQAAGNGNG